MSVRKSNAFWTGWSVHNQRWAVNHPLICEWSCRQGVNHPLIFHGRSRRSEMGWNFVVLIFFLREGTSGLGSENNCIVREVLNLLEAVFFFSLYLSLSSFFLSFFSALSWQMQIYECFQQIHHAETSWFNKLQNNTLLPSIAFAHLLTNLTNRHCIYFLTPLENVTCSSPPVASCLRVICAEHCVPKKFGEPNQLANPKRLKTKSYWENIPQELWFWPGKTWAAMLKRNWPIFHFRFVLFLFSPLAEKRVLNVTLIAHGGCTPHLSPS